jgi:hypothetical protein
VSSMDLWDKTVHMRFIPGLLHVGRICVTLFRHSQIHRTNIKLFDHTFLVCLTSTSADCAVVDELSGKGWGTAPVEQRQDEQVITHNVADMNQELEVKAHASHAW